MKFRWFITKKMLVILIGLLIAMMFWMALTSCIPVTVRPQFDDKGKPIALPVTPTGSISPDGTLNPIYEVSAEAPRPTNWGTIGVIASVALNAFLAAYGINLRGIASKAKTALGIACDLADANAAAETDEEVQRNKNLAAAAQLKANVYQLTQSVRGKTNG